MRTFDYLNPDKLPANEYNECKWSFHEILGRTWFQNTSNDNPVQTFGLFT